jgi:glycosyltransferase involved in cell wall biosynthesis
MQNLITIVVPFFNAMAFLEKNLQSLLSQSDSNIEVILIDDGSSDGSGEWAERWVDQHPRFQLIRQSNRGVSSARNLGLSKARGAWILFVDADDMVHPDFVAAMRAAVQGKDFAVCAYDRVGPKGSTPFVMRDSQAVSLAQVYEHTLCTPVMNGGCCNKIFRMDVIREHGLRFNEQFSVGEDMVFLAHYLKHSQTVGYVPEVLYHYTVNPQSLTRSALTRRQVSDRDASVLLAMDALVEVLKDQGPEVKALGDFRRVRSSLRLLFQMVLTDTREPLWLAHIHRHFRAGMWGHWRSVHARWVERVTLLGFVLAPSALFKIGSFAARHRPRWLFDLRV